jgi:hypothetical protein
VDFQPLLDAAADPRSASLRQAPNSVHASRSLQDRGRFGTHAICESYTVLSLFLACGDRRKSGSGSTRQGAGTVISVLVFVPYG